ncbi:terpene synthase 6, chloroplastic-like isoform X2 [Argentina anserina]|uniref:terpene synthase 6, chloroplastic-like isoform X2 n=1 Tax=Argentina anserina TaxID=57926 RepID=UPI002176916C|nr:terpene synthase 6, chloroplastic-like isoform X2 [Potentilla anserina]
MSFSQVNTFRCCMSSPSSGRDRLPQSVSTVPRSNGAAEGNIAVLSLEGTKQRIKKMFNKVDLSVSSYDTAWVAMVPSPNSRKEPFFPECVNWLLNNQLRNGSWGPLNSHHLLTKDALLSTLACILALKRWNIGEEHIDNGLHFIKSNLASATDNEQLSPVGFNIIFPSMIQSALNLDMNLPVGASTLDALLLRKDVELQRGNSSNSEGWRAYLAYISEGIGDSSDWEMVMKYQKNNGSLFNSPSTTAAAFTHLNNAGCLSYLRSIIEKFGSAVPTIYPLDSSARLSMVSSLECMGIDRHFRDEIKSVLAETYRCWLQGDEDIFSDAGTCAMAFRLLRLHGYEVSADPLRQFSEDCFFNSFGGYLKDTGAALELFRASEVIIHPDESVLEKQHYWTSHFLKQALSDNLTQVERINKHIDQVDDALQFPSYATLGRLSCRKAIRNYNTDSTKILKSSYRCLNVGDEDFLKMAVEDFNMCQLIHQVELKRLSRWVVESRLDKLKFARQKEAYCYFSAAATLFPPELSDARISWAKNGVLTTVVDDFFDVGGSEEELVNLIQLIEKWDVNPITDSCSEQVEIIFSAIKSTVNEIEANAFPRQECSVINHVIEIWLDLVKSMLKEAQWLMYNSAPALDEYMENAYVSFALGPIVLPALYLVGPKLSEEAVRSLEFHQLYKLMSTTGRLLNDMQTFKRESAEGKLNAVTLAMLHGNGSATEEETFSEMKSIITIKRRELQRLVLQKDSVVPRACKDLFWNMCKVVHLFYAKHDGFTGHDLMKTVNGVTQEPIILGELQEGK